MPDIPTMSGVRKSSAVISIQDCSACGICLNAHTTNVCISDPIRWWPTLDSFNEWAMLAVAYLIGIIALSLGVILLLIGCQGIIGALIIVIGLTIILFVMFLGLRKLI